MNFVKLVLSIIDFMYSVYLTGSCNSGNQHCCDCNIALTQIWFILSYRNFCFSVLSQISGIISETPISVAFSKNHSNRLVFFNKEIAIETLGEPACLNVLLS